MGFDNTSEITKKFITMVLCITVILFIFTVIVGLWIVLGKPSPSPAAVVSGANESSVTGVPAKYIDGQISDQELMDGATYVSMVKAASIVMASDEGSAWAQEHPECQLYQAEASLADIRGLSDRWSLIFKSNGSMLMGDVEDGHAASVRLQDMEGLQVPSAGSQRIYDSNSIMSILATNLSINAVPGNLLFQIKYNHDDHIYTINYNDSSNPASYDIRIYAMNGTIAESTYGGPD